MRFGTSVLLEIVSAVQQGIATGTDVSEHLRTIDVQVNKDTMKLELTDEYLAAKERKADLEPV